MRANLSILLMSAVVGTVAFPVQAVEQLLDRVIVVVNDDVVLQGELDQAIDLARSQIRERGIAPPSAATLRDQVLEHLILTRIEIQHAAEAGIHVGDQQLNSVLGNIARQNRMTLPQFIDKMRNDGIDFATIRDDIRDQILINQLRQKEVDSRVVVTDQDVDLLFASQAANDQTEFHLQQIVISLPDNATQKAHDKARTKIGELLKRVQSGEDFSQVAISSSDGSRALEGGDLGWRRLVTLPPLIANAVPGIAIGSVGPILESPTGFTLIKVVARRSDDAQQIVTETHAEHILLAPNTLRDEDASRVQAQDIYQRLKKGEDFEKLAKQFSDDPGSKNSGGDLGWQAPGVFAPDFQRAIDALNPGDISEPFHSQFGWHVARVVGRRTRDMTAESRRSQAKEAIFERKEEEEFEDWLRRLREDSYVEYRLGDGETAPTAS